MGYDLRVKILASIVLILGLFLFWKQPVWAPNQITSGNLPLAPLAPAKTTLVAVGDIMLSRNVGTKIEKAQDPLLPFLNTLEILSNADITFGNLECPLDPGNVPLREGLIFRCLASDAQGLIAAGFDVLSTANNHAFDQGLDNIEYTIEYLKSNNILSIGTLSSATSTIENNIIERKGVGFGFLGYSYSARNDGGKSMHSQISTMHDLENLKSEISNLKLIGADVIIVSMHAGYEYTRTPNEEQVTFAHAAIDAGADVVIGHHPHWIQTIEVLYPPTAQLSPDEGRAPRAESRGREVKTGLIFYSLGNFVFDQMWSQETREGLMVKLQFTNNKLQSAELVPIIIDNYCCPRLATDIEKQKILKKIDLDTDIIYITP